MREYYVKRIVLQDKEFMYVRGNNTDVNMYITLGDFNDFQFEAEYSISGFMNFAEGRTVCGYRSEFSVYGRNKIYELVKYTPEYKKFEEYILGYEVLEENRPIDIRGIRVTDDSFGHRWFSTNSITLDDTPISIADYIINYANDKNFSPDLNYVYCSTESKVVRFILNPECKPLLAKLRLLR